jgi:hypothetical protein
VEIAKAWNPARVMFWASSFAMAVGLGIGIGHYEVFPYSLLKFGKDSLEQVFADQAMLTKVRPAAHLYPIRYPGNGVTRIRADQVARGLTFMSGFFGDNPGLQLVRPDGTVVRQWSPSFSRVFPDTSHIKPAKDIPATDWNVQIHGALALPDGSVVFNFSYKGMVKMDRCGRVQWTLPLMTHHSVERSEDGGFWVPGRHYVGGVSSFPPIPTPYVEDTVVKISADGRVLQETSVPAMLFRDEILRAEWLANGHDDPRVLNNWGDDIIELAHVNDVEELSSDAAKSFPEFAAGDLLVSDRNQNVIHVVDPKTARVKWHQTGPWIRQHDPDFNRDGTLVVFNNNTDTTDDGTIWGGSNIVAMNPLTRSWVFKYGAKPHERMYSHGLGKVQVLENGNILVTESQAGRVFETNSNAEIVWEFINKFDEKAVADITQAIRYPDDYFTVTDWTCN